MPRYIDADLIEYKAICVPMLDGVLVRTKQLDGFYAIKKDIEAIPTADVQEMKHAKNLCEDFPSLFGCSLCKLGRRFIGAEKDEKYFAMGQKRLEDERRVLRLI